MNKAVYINRIAKFLPGDAVSNDEIEDYLGYVGGKKSRTKAITLRNNKITNRYYSIDKEGKVLYSNAELAAEAVRNLCDDDFKLTDIELLTSGTTSPDQLLPGHAVMVHGLLKTRPMEAISFSGACCAGMNSLKYAYMSILTGNTANAVSTASERISTMLTSQAYEEEIHKIQELEANPIIAFEKDFLRWMLSDGAAASLLSDKPNNGSISLRIDWIDICSFANEAETCMYLGGDKDANGNFKGWSEFKPQEWLDKSIFAFKQDTRLLDDSIIKYGVVHYLDILKRRKIDPESIDYFLPHISSEYFRGKLREGMKNAGAEVPEEKWFINLAKVGNVGAASIFIALEELWNSGKLKNGDKIMLLVPESARFSYGVAMLTVC